MSARSHVLILSLIGFLLFGYAVGSKAFAYLGFANFYISEMVLGTCIALFVFSPNFRAVFGSYVSLPFFLLAFVCLTRTLPYIESYGIFALRDGVVYGYLLFAILVAGCLSTPQSVLKAAQMYQYATLLAVPGILVMVLAIGLGGGTDLSEGAPAQMKPGDTAVHLTGVLSFYMLKLGREVDRNDHSWPALLFRVGTAITLSLTVVLALWCVSLSRGALVAMMLGMGTVFIWGYSRKLLAWAAVAFLMLLTMSVVLDLRITTDYREVSARQVVANFVSVFNVDGASIVGSDIDMEALGATANWRIDWWSDIVDYTFFGDMFWTGHGFGPNMATIDGYQVDANGALRSPHSVHMTFLARAGVPGFFLWILSQVAFGAGLVASSLRMRSINAVGWLRLNVWVGIYWLAALTNASFDVYLEGPQGGIWFWCIIGFGMALMHLENQAYRARTGPITFTPVAARGYAGSGAS
jgi:hypothetical protein